MTELWEVLREAFPDLAAGFWVTVRIVAISFVIDGSAGWTGRSSQVDLFSLFITPCIQSKIGELSFNPGILTSLRVIFY